MSIQEQQHATQSNQNKKQKRNSRKLLIFTVVISAFAITIIWLLSSLSIIPTLWASILSAILTVLGVMITVLSLIASSTNHQEPATHRDVSISSPIPIQTPPLIIQFHPSPSIDYPPTSPLISLPTDPESTSQSEHLAKRVNTSRLQQSELQRVNWSEVPYTGNFYGRKDELTTLKRWIVKDHCRLVSILGMGGIGKTALIAKLTEQMKDKFEYIFWCSLQNAPPIDNVLKNSIQFFSAQHQIDLSESIDEQISLLVDYLREHQCLMVLDNVESVMQAYNRVEQYSDGYEGYGRLIQRIGEGQHQSCLLLTSRLKPKEVARIEGERAPVRSISLSGLGQADGQGILRDKGLFGSDEEWSCLINHYAGNPLALKLVAEPIREVFGGDIGEFLKREEIIVDDIDDLIGQQFTPLPEVQQEIMYWLAIEREAVTIDELRANCLTVSSEREVLGALYSLRQRSLIERNSLGLFYLLPVITEYVTERFVRLLCEDFLDQTKLFKSHAIIKASAKDYVRQSQIRVLLKPISDRLIAQTGQQGIENRINYILSEFRQRDEVMPTYAAGNALNLLIYLHSKLSNIDFSRQWISQAYLQGERLPNVNFSNSHFANTVFTETFGGILSLAFDPTQNILAAGTARDEIRFWELNNWTPLRSLRGHSDWVRSVTFSSGGILLATGSEDQTVRLWEVSTGKCLNILRGHTSWICSVAFSPSGNMLASCGDDQIVRLWNTSTSQSIFVLDRHTDKVKSVAFSPDGTLLASGSDDQTIRLWEVSTGKCSRILQGHTGWVMSVAFSPDGALLASGGSDQTVRLWDTSTGQCIHVLQGHTNLVMSVAFSPDGMFLASGSEDQTVRLWETGTARCAYVLQEHTGWVWAVTFSSDGNILASGSDDQTIRLWEVSTGQCSHVLVGYTNWIWAVAYSSDGNLLASGSGDDRAVHLWDVKTDRCLYVLQGHTSWIRTVAFSPDRRLLASGSEDQTIRLWEVSTGRCSRVLQGHINLVMSVAFSPDGRLLASGSEDQTVRLWEIDTGESFTVLQENNGKVWSVAFSPDGTLLASGSDDQTIRLWEVSTGKCSRILQGHTGWVMSVAFSPDGALLASGGSDQTVRLWDTSTGQCIRTFSGHNNLVRCIEFSPDGKHLASSGEDRTVQIWEVSTGERLHILHGHTNRVRSISFNPSTGILASCDDDGNILLWDISAQYQHIKTLRNVRPYEQMNITGISGINETQRNSLKILGANED